MANEYVEALKGARQGMVDVRRRTVLQIRNPNIRPTEYAAEISAIQSAIEAMDRAIADEEAIRSRAVAPASATMALPAAPAQPR